MLVVAFAAEEGARFGAPSIGSRIATGASDADTLRGLRDENGHSAYDSAVGVGLNPADAASARWSFDSIGCFVEVHIEQGRVLREAGGPLGIVSVIGGSSRTRVTFNGVADRSGATPMRLRREALAAAAVFVLEVERRARLQSTAVATIGRLRLRPNSMTTVPGAAELALDVRDIDPQVQDDLTRVLLREARQIAQTRGLGLDVAPLSDQVPVTLDEGIQQRLGDAARSLGLPCVRLPSGASHDSAHLSPHVPTGMVFVPCRDGVSHAPEEFADEVDIAHAADVIMQAFRSVDRDTFRRPGPSEGWLLYLAISVQMECRRLADGPPPLSEAEG